MIIVAPSFEILTTINRDDVLKHLERCGRICYKSEKNISSDSASNFISNIIKSGHESVIEHFNISVKFITDRGVTHELVRHRLASFSQESTRYCNYSHEKFGGEIQVVRPIGYLDWEHHRKFIWSDAMEQAEAHYKRLLEAGCTPHMITKREFSRSSRELASSKVP